MMQKIHFLLGCSAASILILIIAALPLATCDDVIIQKRVDSSEVERYLTPKKRPFCNAFTGCGRKRSDESMATLLELNSEPAVDDLNRQIMSEAKLWEAIQEARIELIRRRHQQLQTNKISDRPQPFTAFRKKRNIGPKSGPRIVDNKLESIITQTWNQ